MNRKPNTYRITNETTGYVQGFVVVNNGTGEILDGMAYPSKYEAEQARTAQVRDEERQRIEASFNEQAEARALWAGFLAEL